MNKTCARCLRTVYPVEELKCLDKVRIKHFLFLINLNRASVHSESGRQYNLLNGHMGLTTSSVGIPCSYY